MDTMGVPSVTRWKILKKSLKYLSRNFSKNEVPSKFITEVHRILKKETRTEIPFKNLRKNCNKTGLMLAGKLERKLKKIRTEYEKFHFLMRWCVAGNHLDFRTAGKGYGFSIDKTLMELKKIAEKRFNVDETKTVFKVVEDSERILFIHDNVGEIAIDALMIKFLKGMDKCVISALRGGAITSDATINDGIEVGLDVVADRIICAGPDTLGISWEEMGDELRQELRRSDLIISKGQANFYVLSEHLHELPPVVFLLTTKCDYVSKLFGFSGKGCVIKLANTRNLKTSH